MILSTPSRARTLGAASALLVIGALALAGCAAATTTDDTDSAASADQSTGDQQMQQTPNGVSGLIAYAEDSLLQVQSSDEQTAVRYTADTTVTKTVAVDASTIAVGDCVTIVTDEDGTTATSVTVSAAADDGTCSTGFGGGGGAPSGDSDSATRRPDGAMPTDMPTDAPDGAAQTDGGAADAQGGGAGFGQFLTGAVTAAADGTLTVESTGFGDDAETTSTDVALTSDTTITGTVDATTDDIATGLCVTAVGEADDAGGYDATSLALSDADENGECSTGLGGMPGGGFPGGAGAGGDTEDSE